ncbi:hypothetical protein B0H14DRAFT_3742401 [Mycena olivaceomarginata]|nr:hypothetical protein B0H14DRAFT_3742401 [Mycena olivaceomarginata]
MSSVGTDNRQEVLDGAVPELMRTVLHKSIGVCVLKKDLVLQGDHYVPATDVPTLGTYLQAVNPSATGVDSTIRFQNQSSLGFATAYVVSPNIVVTAGRCLVDKKTQTIAPGVADAFYIVFGFEAASTGATPSSFQSTQVYEVERILVAQTTWPDYCFLRTSKPIAPDFPPLEFFPPPNVADGAVLPKTGGSIITAGFPLGVPMKATQGTITAYPPSSPLLWMKSTASVFQGCAGSPIFRLDNSGAVSKYVVGTVVVAGADYVLDAESKKVVANTAAVRGDAMRVEAIRWAISPTAYVRIETTFGQLDPPVATTVVVSCTNGGNDYQLATILVPAVSDDAILTDISAALRASALLPIELTNLSFKVQPTNDNPDSSGIDLKSVKLKIMNPDLDNYPSEGICKQWASNEFTVMMAPTEMEFGDADY